MNTPTTYQAGLINNLRAFLTHNDRRRMLTLRGIEELTTIPRSALSKFVLGTRSLPAEQLQTLADKLALIGFTRTPDAVPNEHAPRDWAVGDLAQTPESDRFLVLGFDSAYPDEAICIYEHGSIVAITVDTIHGAKHNTGLSYTYTGYERVLREYKAGFFTPYFEVL